MGDVDLLRARAAMFLRTGKLGEAMVALQAYQDAGGRVTTLHVAARDRGDWIGLADLLEHAK